MTQHVSKMSLQFLKKALINSPRPVLAPGALIEVDVQHEVRKVCAENGLELSHAPDCPADIITVPVEEVLGDIVIEPRENWPYEALCPRCNKAMWWWGTDRGQKGSDPVWFCGPCTAAGIVLEELLSPKPLRVTNGNSGKRSASHKSKKRPS